MKKSSAPGLAAAACLVTGALLLAAAGLYGGQFAPSSGDRPSGGRGKLLYYFLQNILWLVENDLQGRILILAGGGLLLCGLGLTVLAKRMG